MKPTIYRLDRWLGNLGHGTRKEVKWLIRKGRVTVNGETVKSPDLKVSSTDAVTLFGEPVALVEYVYYMMNKPQDVVSATEDNFDETVIELLPEKLHRPGLFPAGRLDKDTEGFVLITNDGHLAHEILAPKKRIPKTYVVHLDKDFEIEKVTKTFEMGLDIGDGDTTSPSQLTVVNLEDFPEVELVIYEGMYHQVKRMFLQFDLEVTYLKRIKIGGLELDNKLELGETKELTSVEIQKIFE